MTLNDIETAFGQALTSVSGVERIAWPARVSDPLRPFVMFQHAPGDWLDRTMTGGGKVQASGAVVLTAVTSLGSFTTAANTLASSLLAAFPKGRRLAITGGCVVVTGVRPLPGTQDGADWRQPIEVSYTTSAA